MALTELDRFFHRLAEELTVIYGQAYLARRELSSQSPQQGHLQAIQQTVMKTATRMQAITQHGSMPETTSLPPSTSPTDLTS